MSFSLDPDIEAVVGPFLDSGPPLTSEPGDWMSLRTLGDAGTAAMDSLLPAHEEIERMPFAVTSFDGSEVSVCWYVQDRATSTPGPAVVYLHGGGMLMGSLQMSDHYVAGHVAESGVPMLSVDYRLAPEHPHPTPVEDCYAALGWLYANSEELAVDPGRVAIMGDSAGGGLAAATALLARDRGLRLAKQILIYPMLDDRNTTPDPQLVPFMLWSYENNELGWRALLGDAAGPPMCPESPRPPEPKTSRTSQMRTWRWGNSTSSGTSASNTRGTSHSLALRPSSTSGPAVPTDSTESPPLQRSSFAPGRTGSGS